MYPYRPTIVCLCGSTRFSEAYQRANLLETLAGKIVLTIGCDMHADADMFVDKTDEELVAIKQRLDALHLLKINLADEVLILNVDGYVGESTRREFEYAVRKEKKIRWLEPDKALTVDSVPAASPRDLMKAIEIHFPDDAICIVDTWKDAADVIHTTWYGEDWQENSEVSDSFRLDVIEIGREEFTNLEPFEL